MASITKNISNTAKLSVQGTSTFLTVVTNPYFLILIGVLFLPLDILNYIILFIVNFIIVLANILIFVVQIILYSIINLAGMLINIPIEWFNDLEIHIPVIDIDLPLPDLPTIPTVDYPPYGAIPPYSVDDVRIFTPGTVLILYFLDLLGISYPFA